MKFGKNLLRVVELSDPEWGPYWINYKYLKKKINDIVLEQGGKRIDQGFRDCNPQMLVKSASEVEFFRVLKYELGKTSAFFSAAEEMYKVRRARVFGAYSMLVENKDASGRFDGNAWTRLLTACVKFYKDVLLLENFAIMNYCGFSKILKKHDKLTGFSTREAYMRKVVSKQNFTHYPYILELLKESERLFEDIQALKNAIPLHAEERLFIEAIRDLNFQASRLQAEENSTIQASAEETNGDLTDDSNSDGNEHKNVKKVKKKAIPESNGEPLIISNFQPNPPDHSSTADLTLASKLFPYASSEAERSPRPRASFDLSDGATFCEPSPENSIPTEKYLPYTLPPVSLPAVGYSLSALDPTSGLDRAAALVSDAASKANICNPSPCLKSTLSWMRTMSREHVHELESKPSGLSSGMAGQETCRMSAIERSLYSSSGGMEGNDEANATEVSSDLRECSRLINDDIPLAESYDGGRNMQKRSRER